MSLLTTDALKKLQQKKYRQRFGYFLADGEHLALELEAAADSNPALLASEFYVTARYEHWETRLRKHLISEKLMQQLSDTQTPQGIIACVPMAALQQASRRDTATRSVYLHEIQDPGNLGTILRTLAWFGGFSCLLGPGSVDPFNAKVVRASMGAVFHVPMECDVDISSLTQRFSHIASLDMQGEALTSASFRQMDCLVFGNEARGVPRAQLDALGATLFTIPGKGQVDSLNVASAVNICLYELNR